VRHGEEIPEEEGPSQERGQPRQAPQLLTLTPRADHEVNVMIGALWRG
jgi:hypothetical protein